jgi:hypothetical protein
MKSLTMPLKAMGSDGELNSHQVLTVGVPPNPTLNRTCNSVRRPGLISFWPGRRPLPHAG